MEHRWNPRKEINSPVMVYQEQIGIIKASVKNVSADGMLVETGGFGLTKGAVVELAGATLRSIESKMLRLKALIIHADDGVAGLMFIANREKIADLWGNFEHNRAEESSLPISGMDGAIGNGDLDRAAEYASF